MKDMYISLPSGGGKITDIESTGNNFIRFKNGYQICWGLEISSNMDHGSTGGSGSGGGGAEMPISLDDNTKTYGGTKTFTFPAQFIEIPYIVISPASGNSYQTSNNGSVCPPTAWYHDESTAGFIAELSVTAVKLTWIAMGKWK